MTSIARVTGNSIEQFVRAASEMKGAYANPKTTHIQFKLDQEETPDMLRLIGFKGYDYHLRYINGKYHFTVSLKG
jgi:hypothetical protein